MPSIPRTSTSGRRLLTCFFSLLPGLLLLSSAVVHGASFRAHRLRGSESDGEQRGNVYNPPNADMLKALQYIESLHQRAGLDSQQQPPLATGSRDGRVGESGKPRTPLRLTSAPVRADEEAPEEKSEELLQAVLSTLQQTGKAPQPGVFHVATDRVGAKEDRLQQDKHSIKPHKQLPLMFEDEEEGEGEEENGPEPNTPLKRTNENVEEKYTPQNLATLQSIFDELDKLTLHKRQEEDEEEEEEENEQEEEEEENDMFDERNVQYDDMNEDLTDWDPVDEQDEEDEEEERENKQKVDRRLEFMNNNGEEATEDDEEDDGRYAVKRSNEPDDMANLVDFYLLKVLEKTEEEEQKRQIEEEEQEMKRAERRVSHAQLRESLTPAVIYQLIQISKKYQIRPEDLIDMLRSEDKTGPTGLRKSKQLPRAGNKQWQSASNKLQTSPEVDFYNSRLPSVQKSAEELRREKILQILGLGGNNQATPLRKHRLHSSLPSRLRTQLSGRLGKPSPTHSRLSTLRSDYGNTADEDQLTAYVAAQMMAKYPQSAYGKYKVSQKRDEVGPSAADSFEKAMEDYFDDMDSDQSLNEKRQVEDEERDDGTQVQGFENETMLKLLNYLNPETDGNEPKKTDGGE